MKKAFYFLLLSIAYIPCTNAQQVKKTDTTRVEEVQEVPQNPFQQDTTKGNAGRNIKFIYGTESCASGMRGIVITNTSDKVVAAKVEVTTVYNGHTSRKIINVDNLSPDEKRTIGCTGCSDKSLFTTCITYRAAIAVFK